MTITGWIADKLILCPSSHAIDPGGKRRQVIPTPNGEIEAWVAGFPEQQTDSKPEVVIVKFPGTGGRAERAGVHPAEIWELPAEIWTINPKGYGGSTGPASIKFFPETATSVLHFIRSNYPDIPIVVVGNSLGCVSALYVSATQTTAGVILRNPPPLQQLIRTRPRYAAWNFGMSAWIANEVPVELDGIVNASMNQSPCLFVQSEKDKVVPVRYQNLIIDAYSGPKRVFHIQGADHHESVPETQSGEYFQSLHWLAHQWRS